MITPSTCRFEDGYSPFERLLNDGLKAKRRLEEAGCFDTSAFHAMVEEAVEIIESEDEDAKGCKKRATLGDRSSADILREVLELLEAAVAVDNGAVAAYAYGLATKLMERLAVVEPPGQGRDIEGCRTD
jgi:hypothetical protein